MSCSMHLNPCSAPEFCQRQFERASSYCGKCWNVVTNASYFAKNSKHITGKCSEKHVIPSTIYQRTADRNCKHSSEYYNARWLARQTNLSEPTKWLMQRIRLLEEQNRLLRQLAA